MWFKRKFNLKAWVSSTTLKMSNNLLSFFFKNLKLKLPKHYIKKMNKLMGIVCDSFILVKVSRSFVDLKKWMRRQTSQATVKSWCPIFLVVITPFVGQQNGFSEKLLRLITKLSLNPNKLLVAFYSGLNGWECKGIAYLLS